MNNKKTTPEIKSAVNSSLTTEQKIELYHKSRRMFCIYKKKLIIAERNANYSHAEWFSKNKWKYQDKDLMNEIVRGIIDDEGDIYFYIGHNHTVTEKCETVFFTHLKELSEKLKLKQHARIFGGLIRGELGDKWPPIKKYGTIREITR